MARLRLLRFGLVSVLVLVAAACRLAVPGDEGFPRREPTESGVIEELKRETPFPLYYLGGSVAGFPLTDADSGRPGWVTFIYGTCEPHDPDGFFGPEGGSCAPPIAVQNFRYVERDWRFATGCDRLPSLRGVPTVRHDGLVLFTGPVAVKIYGPTRAEERRLALALRALDGSVGPSAPLPPPRNVEAALASCR